MTPKKTNSTLRHGLARVISKQGLASRTQAAQWIAEGRVQVNGKLIHDAEFPVRMGVDVIAIAGAETTTAVHRVIMLNKPRGLVTTTSDEKNRDTVYSCFDNADLPWLAPIGRLDKASEGLLLFSNDPQWAARITDPASCPNKTYHVQINAIPNDSDFKKMVQGIVVEGASLAASTAKLLRHGEKNAWLEIILDEGKNRQIRRLLTALDFEVLRLIRVAIGSLQLGELAKGEWRELSADEVKNL